eukprot:366494-Chlamydomonas_euryale.AAC.2
MEAAERPPDARGLAVPPDLNDAYQLRCVHLIGRELTTAEDHGSASTKRHCKRPLDFSMLPGSLQTLSKEQHESISNSTSLDVSANVSVREQQQREPSVSRFCSYLPVGQHGHTPCCAAERRTYRHMRCGERPVPVCIRSAQISSSVCGKRFKLGIEKGETGQHEADDVGMHPRPRQ